MLYIGLKTSLIKNVVAVGTKDKVVMVHFHSGCNSDVLVDTDFAKDSMVLECLML